MTDWELEKHFQKMKESGWFIYTRSFMVSPPAAQSMSVVINDPMCGMEHALTHDHMPEKTSQSLVIS